MAGIGFVLRELERRETFTGALSAAGHGMVVAAGPWIFTVVSLALIHRGTTTVLSTEASYNFRSFVMYAFAISLLATAPVVNVSVRLASDDIYQRTFTGVRSRYLAAVLASALLSAVTAVLVHVFIFGLNTTDLLIATGSTVVISLVWPTLAFCGAVKDYKGITAGFALGMLMSILATIWIARMGYGAPMMMVTFLCGLSIVFFALASRILLAFPDQVGGIGEQLTDLVRGIRRHWVLAFGSLFAIAAVWADKWVMWFGPDQVVLSNGLLSAPLYDGAMFLAYLTMIPALGLFVTAIETTFFEDSRRMLDAIRAQAPLSRIERLRDLLETQTYRTIYRVLMTLGAICAIAILVSPSVVSLIGLQYQQLGVFRLGVMAVFFQFMFVASTSIILFLDQQIKFVTLQLLFLASQIGFTLMSIWLGHEFFGYGHLIACACCAFVSMAVLERTLTKIVYLTFATAVRRPSSKVAAAAVKEKIAPHPVDIDREEDLFPAISNLQVGPLLRPSHKHGVSTMPIRNKLTVLNSGLLHAAAASALVLASLSTVLAAAEGDTAVMPAAAEANVPPAADPSPAGSDVDAQAAGQELMIGDKLQISFFEQLDLGQTSDSKMTADVRTFYQRLDLTGEKVVDADGSINIPLLGRFVVSGMSMDEAEASIMDAYQNVLGRPGNVNISMVARKPVFATGIVKAAGSFDYAPGMIALQVIALAGGYDREAEAATRLIDSQRERERYAQAKSRLESLTAKRDRLIQQRDALDDPNSAKLEKRTDAGSMSTTVAGEQRLLEAELSEAASTSKFQDAKLANAKVQVDSMRSLSDLVAAQVDVRGERLRVLQQMQGRGLSTLEIMWNAQRDVSDFKMQHERLLAEIKSAEHNVVQASTENDKVKVDRRVEIERLLVDVEDEINQHQAIASASDAMIKVLETANTGRRIGEPLRIRIMRRTPTQTLVIDADETTGLRPGDVVKVEVVPEGTTSQSVASGSL